MTPALGMLLERIEELRPKQAGEIRSFSLGDRALILTAELGPCGQCGRLENTFINRNGQTRCVRCDRKATESQRHGDNNAAA